MRRKPMYPNILILSGVAAALVLVALALTGDANALDRGPQHLASQTLALLSNVEDFEMRINTGGEETTDSEGNLWFADQSHPGDPFNPWGYIGGNSVDRRESDPGFLGVSGTTDQDIFSTERWGTFIYQIKLPNGTYTVRLMFAETWGGIADLGPRVFDVTINGSKVISDLNLFEEIGFAVAHIEEFDAVEVTSGEMVIEFEASANNAIVDGIEIVTSDAPIPTPTPTTPPATATPKVIPPTPTDTPSPTPTDTPTPVTPSPSPTPSPVPPEAPGLLSPENDAEFTETMPTFE